MAESEVRTALDVDVDSVTIMTRSSGTPAVTVKVHRSDVWEAAKVAAEVYAATRNTLRKASIDQESGGIDSGSEA